jgi:hypothetical protein
MKGYLLMYVAMIYAFSLRLEFIALSKRTYKIQAIFNCFTPKLFFSCTGSSTVLKCRSIALAGTQLLKLVPCRLETPASLPLCYTCILFPFLFNSPHCSTDGSSEALNKYEWVL